MGLKSTIAIAACKLSLAAARMLKKGGTASPGKIALKIDPNVLGKMTKGVNITVVTGTNGKTTTSRMIDEAMKEAKLSYLANRSGANLLSGIVTIFAENSSITGKCRKKHALIECDEAAFRRAGKYLNAKCVVVTNVFRDQLDRYGEISHTIQLIKEGIDGSPNAVVCLNADDSMTSSIASQLKNPIKYFGVDTPIYDNQKPELSDAPYCIRCKHEYQYKYITYGHLGGFYCPNCGYSRPDTDFSAAEIVEAGADSSQIKLKMNGNMYDCRINLPGGYNIYNAVSAAAACSVMGIKDETVISSLNSFSCGFGRMEKVSVGETDIRMILVKNPAGCNQALSFVSNIKTPTTLVFALNDRYADSTDVSWIWDVDYEKLGIMGDALQKVYVTGIRADDMATRLKYAGVPQNTVTVEKDYDRLFSMITAGKGDVIILPTYTAMLELREKLSKLTDMTDFWEG